MYVAGTADGLISVTSTGRIVNIVNNIIEGVHGPEIHLTAGATGVIIGNNTFFNTPGINDNTYEVIRASGTGSGSTLTDVSITNNLIYGYSPTLRYSSLITYAGTFGSTDRWTVTGNTVRNAATMIVGTPPDDPTVRDNVLFNGTQTLRSNLSGSAVYNGDGIATTFTIATGLYGTVRSGYVQAASAAAGTAGVSWWEVSGANIIVHTTAAPASGTNNVMFAWSASVSGVVGASAPDTTAPTVPGTPTATAGVPNNTLTWTVSTDASGVTGYNVYRSDAPTVILGASANNTYTDIASLIGTAVTYTAAAYDAAGNLSAKSAASNSVTATSPADSIPPSTPGTPTATAGAGFNSATWTASTDNVAVTGYNVYRSDAPTVILGTTATNSYTDNTAPTGGVAVSYAVAAYDAAANLSTKSASSNAVMATSAGATFVTDSFTGTAASNLTAHTGELGATWTTASGGGAGVPKLSTLGRVYNTGASSSVTSASGTPASADYSVEADLTVRTLLAGTSAGVALRVHSANLYGYGLRYAVTSGAWQIVTYGASGTGATLVFQTATLTVGTTYHIKLVASGTTLTAFVDGTQILTGTDATSSTAGNAAVVFTGATGASDTTGLHVDNFSAL
jgi:hypothetical protein